MRIAVDAFGGDNAPDEIIKGSIKAAESKEYEIILVGNEEIIKRKLSEFGYNGKNISIKHASEVIEVSEEPVKAIRAIVTILIIVLIKSITNDNTSVYVISASCVSFHLSK